MKALVYTAPNEVTFRDEPEPVAGSGDVMLAVEAAGICGSDMHAFHGRDPRRNPPLILGHELAARILDGPLAGRRVTVNPLITCGRCEYCVTGRDNLCARRTMIGMTRPGGFAERIAVPERTLIEIPDAMPARVAALTEPAATALHALNLGMRALSRPLPETRMRVVGGGAVGLLAALLAHAYGCRDVSLAETNPLRRVDGRADRSIPRVRSDGGAERSRRTSRISSSMRSAPGARATPRSPLSSREVWWSTSASPTGRARSTCASSRCRKSR